MQIAESAMLEVDDVAQADAVDEVADDAAKEEPGDGRGPGMVAKDFAPEDEAEDDGQDADAGEPELGPLEHAPRRALVPHVGEGKDREDVHALPGPEVGHHPQFGGLVEGEDREGDGTGDEVFPHVSEP